jgi:hypothetical protein
MKTLLSFISLIFLLPNLSIAQPTFAENVAEIVYNKCTTCHRQDEIGPFLLTNYDEVSSYAQTIKAVTVSKYMPPWKADTDYQHYLGEYYLTEGEIQTISDWVDAGSPRGDVNLEPELPVFPDESSIGEPDLVLEFEVAHLHKGNNQDEYRYFVLPTGLLEDKKVKAIELRPGNARIVHHALFFQDLTGTAAEFDAKTAEYGFEGTAGFDDDAVLSFDQYPAYAPGQRPRYFPDGMAQTLNAGSDLVVQMHYAPFPTDELDKSTVNIFFADEDEEIDREVEDELMLPFNLPGGFNSFFIPANQTKEFIGTWNINKDVSLIGVFPHMHLLGRYWEVWLERPDGTTENLIKINDWDFNWQGTYYFNRFIIAPKGSKVKAKAKYDNTVNNPFNPNSPPKLVFWGEKTTDEMYYIPIVYVDYKDGDENVIFDQMTGIEDLSFGKKQSIQIFPNPSTGSLVNVAFELPSRSPITAKLYDINGKLIRVLRNGEHFPQGKNIIHLNPNTLVDGVYTINITGINYSSSEQVIIKQ